jgi:spermidine synthase
MASVSVVADAQGIERLRINNRAQEGSSASGLVEWRLAQLPLLLHAAPRHALFLGLGTGFTAAAAAQESVQVDAVELLPEVIEAAGHFAQSPHAPRVTGAVRSVAADARRFVQAGDRRYDVIVSDLFHPARSGAGALYTVEQFSAVRQRLAPNGLFCQWLALHQMDLDSLRSIVAAFMQVYPQALAVLASNSLDSPVLGLIARPDQPGFDVTELQTQLEQIDPVTRRAARLEDVFALLGSVLAGPQALAEFAHDAPVNSDNHPVVVHQAPWTTYAPQTTPRQRLLTLLRQLQPRADQVLRAPHGIMADRLQAYWEARRRYIELGASTRFAADPAVMLARTEQPLLALLRLSPDFRPAYDPLRSMAKAIEATDPAHAKALANELQVMRLPWLDVPTGLAQP